MALVKCQFCGKEISDKARKCPHCGAVLIDEEVSRIVCDECGAEIPDGAEACPKCGCPVKQVRTEVITRSIDAQEVSKATEERISSMKKRFIGPLVAILLIIGLIFINQNVLFGKDKVAYDIIVRASTHFKNPGSIRLVSGELGVQNDCLFCGISATNGFGARSTEYYFIFSDGRILEEEDPESWYKSTTELNIVKINKKLAKTLGSGY